MQSANLLLFWWSFGDIWCLHIQAIAQNMVLMYTFYINTFFTYKRPFVRHFWDIFTAFSNKLSQLRRMRFDCYLDLSGANFIFFVGKNYRYQNQNLIHKAFNEHTDTKVGSIGFSTSPKIWP